MPDTCVDTTPPQPGLEFRVSHLEQEMGDVKSILAQMLAMMVRIDATLPHLATKAELQSGFAAVDAKIGAVIGEIGRLDGKIGDLAGEVGRVDGRIGELVGGLASEIGRLDGKIGDLRAEVHSGDGALKAEMHSEFGRLRADLAEKPSRTYLWMVLGALIMAYAAGLAGLAVLK